MEHSEQIRRIMRMEHAMETVAAAAEALERALGTWEASREALRELTDYYDGGLWLRDFQADEAGQLPAGLKRGVLSEDGLYDLLQQVRELEETLGHGEKME